MARDEIDVLEVTPENFGELLVESARQAVAIARRDAPELRKRICEQRSVIAPGQSVVNARKRSSRKEHK